MTVLISVTHLLGTGHLGRALVLARAFAAAGHRAIVASGGMPVSNFDTTGVTLHQLPPLRSDGTNFTRLLTDTGAEADAPYLARRRAQLSALIRDCAPDALITELYPFGRRVLRDEFLAALETAQALPRRPVILSSIRDILAPPSKPAKATRADEIIARHYDAVLVHSDPGVTTLDQSWPVSPMLAAKLRYTGFVAAPPPGPHPTGEGAGDILVSAGGGDVGQPLFQAALGAARAMPSHRWRLLVGGQDVAGRIAGLAACGIPDNAVLEPARPDFRQMLSAAAASVSMCGYNTAMDLLQTGTPALLIPFDDGKEVEQGLRADALARLDGVALLRAADLGADAMARGVAQVLSAPRRDTGALQFDGAARSVALTQNLIEARP
ncbi:MAG: glycosyltransferase [Marinibacterium sp.]|nr:glycosyltransferase [Marinibacterium sp.]